MAQFFIRRPIVAIVISVLIVIMGLFTLSRLSFEQYPFLAPPTIRITATYPGASAVAGGVTGFTALASAFGARKSGRATVAGRFPAGVTGVIQGQSGLHP